jgi:DNA-directed RNA polymerase subunit omega
MIEALKHEEIVTKIGGRFRLTAMIQKRLVELLEGSRPLVERKPGMTNIEVVIDEILQDKVTIDTEKTETFPTRGSRRSSRDDED